jgi:hypothetical protein
MSEIEKAYKVNDEEENYVVAGFHKLDGEDWKRDPPMITWGVLYKDHPDEKKVAYLEKLASAMNHAAFLMQIERNELLDICKKQELQIETMKEGLDANNSMIQEQITNMNAERQNFNKAAAAMKKRIRELENGSVD